MASHHLPHLTLPSTYKPSIALILIITTAFLVPFLAISTTPALGLIPTTLPNVASALWDSSLNILTSSPFYFLLLNLLVFALLLSSGILTPPSRPSHGDDVQEADLQSEGHHGYRTAAQIMSERLALDELYGSQVTSVPYLTLTERSNLYIREDNPQADEEEANCVTIRPNTTTFLQPGPTFLGTDPDAQSKVKCILGDGEISNSSSPDINKHTAEGFAFAERNSLSSESETKTLSAHGSIITHSEIQERKIRDEQEDKHMFVSSNADVCDDAGEDDGGGGVGDALVYVEGHGESHCSTGGNVDTQIYDEDVNGRGSGEAPSASISAGTGSHDDGKNADGKDIEMTAINSGSDEPVEAGGENAGAEIRESVSRSGKEEVAVVISYNGEGEEGGEEQQKQKQRQRAGDEEEEEEAMTMSAEELNERASAFISAFRRKLISDS